MGSFTESVFTWINQKGIINITCYTSHLKEIRDPLCDKKRNELGEQWGQCHGSKWHQSESLLLLFIRNPMKEMLSVHCNIQNCDVFFCILSTFMLSCWLNHCLGQTLIKLCTVVCSIFCCLQLEAGQNSALNPVTLPCSQGTRSGTDWGLNQQRLQKLPVHAHMGGLAFLFPQAHQMPTISISTKSEPLIWRKEIIHGEGYTKDICPCFVSEGVHFFYSVSLLHECCGSNNIWNNM